MTPHQAIESFDLGKLPSGPRILARLTAAVRRPEAHLGDVAEILHSDPALTARVVAACNSTYYARGRPTADIREAVLHLGLKEVTRIVQVVVLTDFRRSPTQLYTQTAGYFWERSLHTALVVDRLSAGNPAAYTAAIMHLVGVWVLCRAFPQAPVSMAERELELQAELERLRLGLSFAEAGGGVLERWGFDRALCAAVRWQIDPAALTEPGHFELGKLLYRASAVANWHYGAQSVLNMRRSGLTQAELEECNALAAEQVAQIGAGL